MHTLTVVRKREKLWDLSAAPDSENLFSMTFSVRIIIVVGGLIHKLLCNRFEITLQVSCLEAIGSDSDQVDIMIL